MEKKANDFGKTKWLPVRIRHPKFETTTLQNGNEVSHLADHDVKDDYINLNDFDFASRSGRAYRDGDEISLHVHSNLCYTLKLTKEA